MYRCSHADHVEMVTLVRAVFENHEELTFEPLFLVTKRGRRPEVTYTEGVSFGVSGNSRIRGYLVNGSPEPSIAENMQVPKRHSELHARYSIREFLNFLGDETPREQREKTIDLAMYAVERLLPDGHPLKRPDRHELRVGVEV